jgi:hypothetical protein
MTRFTHRTAAVFVTGSALVFAGCCDFGAFGGCSCDLSGGCSDNSVRSFEATLSGNNVVPPVATSASGSATFQLDADLSAAQYRVTVSNLLTADSASLYVGNAGMNGTARVTLCAPCTTTDAGVLAVGSAPVSAAVVTAMRAFGTYVEIRTASGPVLRGQLRVVG